MVRTFVHQTRKKTQIQVVRHLTQNKLLAALLEEGFSRRTLFVRVIFVVKRVSVRVFVTADVAPEAYQAYKR